MGSYGHTMLAKAVTPSEGKPLVVQSAIHIPVVTVFIFGGTNNCGLCYKQHIANRLTLEHRHDEAYCIGIYR